jgi:predicted phage-related endonuclease
MPLDKGCYLLYNVEQGSDDWKEMRKGRITMSNMGKVVGHAPYYKGTKEELALEIRGRLKVFYSKEALARMRRGTEYEPKVRDLLSKRLGIEITETGFAVWKKDKRFGASLDGVIDDETGIEIKCPAKMYMPILHYMQRRKKGEAEDDEIDHIWKSQYDQVIGNGVITGRKWMYFCVYGIEDKNLFIQKVRVDYDYWNNFLYPTACEFYDEYMS